MKYRRVEGSGGVSLHVVETGNAKGRPILFIHGFSQCWLAWRRQLSSELADDFRLVAMDLRGHGLSDKPQDGYDDSRLWADDVDAIVRTLELDQPVLSGWSYGPLVILDYVRYHGEDQIGGIHFVDGVTKLGDDEATSLLSPEFQNLIPGFFATDLEESIRSLQGLGQLCFVDEPSPEDRYMILGYNVSVPPYVRQALFSRLLDNDDLLARIRKPVLITHGADDAIISPTAVDRHAASLAHAETHVMPDAGHAPFWDDATAFNRRLRTFAENL